MEVRMNRGIHGKDDITYLYALKSGRCTSSYGVLCAELNGVAPDVLARANVIALMLAQNKRLGVACARMSREEETLLEVAEKVARRFMATERNVIRGFKEGAEARKTLMDILAAGGSTPHEYTGDR
jgi:DNA mismatch repair protein MSH5